MKPELVKDFVLSYLYEIEAELKEEAGIYSVVFPPGRKRRFGGERRFTFDAAFAQPHVEVLEPGSPLLKLLLGDAKLFGGVGVSATAQYQVGTVVFTFQFNTYSSLKKRTRFVTAFLLPEATTPRILDGISPMFEEGAKDAPVPRDVERVQNALAMVMPPVEAAARAFAHDAVEESEQAFHKSLGRVNEYFQGLRMETAAEEARIRKRLGEIQSKLYFAEDGLRQLKLERERDRLTQEIYQLKQKRTQSEEKLSGDHVEHVERQRRRYEPKLQIRLVAATLVQPPSPPGRAPPKEPLPEPANVPTAPEPPAAPGPVQGAAPGPAQGA